jgi:hypothetical protein
MGLSASVGCSDDQRGFGARQAGHVKFELGISGGTGARRKLGRLRRAFHFGGHRDTCDGMVGVIAHGNLKKSAFASEPRLGVEQLQVERIRPGRGIRAGLGSSGPLVRWNG